jgi:F-type H+-transporting ATPase subunit a
MSSSNIFGLKHLWYPLSYFGLTQRTFGVAVDTMINTWILGGIFLILIGICRFFLAKKDGLGRFIVLSIFQVFYDMCKQGLPKFTYRHFSFITTLAFFLIFSNTLATIPFLEEPTSDLNTTFALAIIAFCYIQYHGVRAQGIKKYMAHYFEPIFIMFPLHVMGKLSMIISLSFRLYGNLLGGSTIMHYFFGYFGKTPTSLISSFIPIVGLILSPPLIGIFSVIEGLVQAFVFTLLTLTYLSIETQTEG